MKDYSPMNEYCGVAWGVCPKCYAIRLSVVTEGLSCPSCKGVWPTKARVPCPEMSHGELWSKTTGKGKGQWLCPSHMTLFYNDAIEAASEHEKPVPLDWHRAVHEAGHVFVARYFGFRVTSVRIVPDPNDSHHGATDIEWGDTPIDEAKRRVRAENMARVSFAGVSATALYAPDPISESAAVDDRGMAAWVLTKEIDGCKFRVRRNRLMGEAMAGAADILSNAGSAIDQIAKAIVSGGRLDEAEILALVDPLIPRR